MVSPSVGGSSLLALTSLIACAVFSLHFVVVSIWAKPRTAKHRDFTCWLGADRLATILLLSAGRLSQFRPWPLVMRFKMTFAVAPSCKA